MANYPLMPKATAAWLVDNTALTFDQIAEFPPLCPLVRCAAVTRVRSKETVRAVAPVI